MSRRRKHDDPSVAGLVLVDKPAGLTSHDVVSRVRRVFGVGRVGHSGTLDPAATGLLLVGVGWATRVLRFTGTLPKTYVGEVTFGTATSTMDAEGDVTESCQMQVTREALLGTLAGMKGEQEQLPPMVSAVKVGGERLYEKARRGEVVAREPRRVTLHELELLDFTDSRATLRVSCSAGTYVRVLAHDLGVALGGHAHLSALRRTAIGPHDVGDAFSLEALEGAGRAALLPPAAAMAGLPQLVVDEATEQRVRQGQRLETPLDVPTALLDGQGALLGVYEPDGSSSRAACVAPAVVG